jgi:hypothetical protein
MAKINACAALNYIFESRRGILLREAETTVINLQMYQIVMAKFKPVEEYFF